MITYKFKLYSSKKNRHLNQQVRVAGCIYNHIIALHKRYHQYFKQYPSVFTLNKHVTKLKKQNRFIFWNQLNSQSIQNVVERIDFGFKKFFRKENKRPPSFRSIRKFKSFTLKQTGYKLLEDNQIQIGKKIFKYYQSRDIKGIIKNVIVKKDAVGDFYLFFVTDHEENRIKTMTGKSAGFDFGLKIFLTGSDESEIKSPEFFKHGLNKIKKAARNLSSKKKGSNNRALARLSLARAHKKIANQRSDFHFKLAKDMCLKYDFIFLETLNLSGMKKRWGRKVSDLGFAQFVSILHHQASKNGTVIHHIDKWFPSSKMCSVCLEINHDLKLSEREWICPHCGAVLKRDPNAASNVFREGTSSLRLGHVSPPLAAMAA